MNFDLSEEQQLLADSLKRYLANEYSIDARAKIVASPTGWSETVWAAIVAHAAAVPTFVVTPIVA